MSELLRLAAFTLDPAGGNADGGIRVSGTATHVPDGVG